MGRLERERAFPTEESAGMIRPGWPSRLVSAFLCLLVCRPASAEIMPRFDLNTCAGCARYVVLGTLDARGNLRVKSLLKGKGLEARVRFDDHEGHTFHALRKTMALGEAEEIEVVAFLLAARRNAWVSVTQSAGVVGVGDDGVYMYRAAHVPGGARLERHPEHTRASFLLAIESAVTAAEERDGLLASPRSPSGPDDSSPFSWSTSRCWGAGTPSLRGERAITSHSWP